MSYFIPDITSGPERKGYSNYYPKQPKELLNNFQQFPIGCVGFITFHDKTYNRIVKENACLVGPYHVMVNAKCLMIPETKMLTEANIEFSTSSKSTKVVRVYVNKALDKVYENEQYNFALLLIENYLGEEFGYFGILAIEKYQKYFTQFETRKSEEKKIFVAGFDKKNNQIYEQIGLYDHNDKFIYFQSNIIKGLVFCYDNELGFLLIATNIKNLALQNVSTVFSIDQFNQIIQWINGVNALPKYFNNDVLMISEMKDYLQINEIADRNCENKAYNETVQQICKVTEDQYISISKSGKLKMWNLNSQQIVQEIQSQHFCKNIESIISEADILVIQGQGMLLVYNLLTNDMHGVYPTDEQITCCVKLNSNYFAIGTSSGELIVYRFYKNLENSNKVILQQVVKIPNKNNHIDGHSGKIKSICSVDTNQNLMASASEDNTVKVWDFISGKMKRNLQIRKPFSILGHNKMLIVPTRDHYIHFLEKNTLEEIKKLKFSCIRQTAIINQKELLVAENNQLKIVNLSNWQSTNISKKEHFLSISAIQCMSQSCFITGDETGHIIVWRIDNEQLRSNVKPNISLRNDTSLQQLSPTKIDFHFKCKNNNSIINDEKYSDLETSKNEFLGQVYGQENVLLKEKIKELQEKLFKKDEELQLSQENQQKISYDNEQLKIEFSFLQTKNSEDVKQNQSQKKTIEELTQQMQQLMQNLELQDKAKIERELINMQESRTLQQKKIEVLVQEIRLLQDRLSERSQEDYNDLVGNSFINPNKITNNLIIKDNVQQKINFLQLSEEFQIVQNNLQQANRDKNLLVQECQNLKNLLAQKDLQIQKDTQYKIKLTDELEKMQEIFRDLNNKITDQHQVSEIQKVITVDKINKSKIQEISYREQVFNVKLREKEQIINDLYQENNKLRLLLQQYELNRNERIYNFKNMLNTNQKEFLHLKSEIDELKELETPVKVFQEDNKFSNGDNNQFHNQIAKRLFSLEEQQLLAEDKKKMSPEKQQQMSPDKQRISPEKQKLNKN